MKSQLDGIGREIPDGRPMFLDVGPAPLTLKEQIQRMVRGELSRRAVDKGHESFDESNDFNVEEDNEPLSKYEVMEDEVPVERKPKKGAEKAQKGPEKPPKEEPEKAKAKGPTEEEKPSEKRA